MDILKGNLAATAATSTGDTKNKLPGRVGDCVLVSLGGYADIGLQRSALRI